MSTTGRLFCLLPLALLSSCNDQGSYPQQLELTGATMGTTFSVSIILSEQAVDTRELEQDINVALQNIEKSMSTYAADSELSRFNQHKSTTWVPASIALCDAIAQSLEIAKFTGGSFDITVGPLVNLWGFGPTGTGDEPPSEAEVKQVRRHVGFEKLSTDCAASRIRKSDEKVYVDLSAYAKGLAVDKLADILQARGVRNFLAEIGGEIRLQGVNRSASPWRIAIEKPINDGRSVERIIQITEGAVATSGDYRNFIDYNGKRYSHAINPHTGTPVSHKLASVTVIDEKAALADALATALFVMGPEQGPRFAEQHSIAALFLIYGPTNVSEHMSPGFEKLLTR